MISYRDCLNPSETRALEALTASCNNADGTRYAVPSDADFWLFLYPERSVPADTGTAMDPKASRERIHAAPAGQPEHPSPLAVLAVFHLGTEEQGLPVDEFVALTDPSFRRRGAFRELFAAARPLLRPVLHLSAAPVPDAESFLLHLGAVHTHDEYLMVCELPHPETGPEANPDADQSAPLPLSFAPQAQLTEVSCRYGECVLSPWGEDVYLAGLLIYARFRGQGCGTRFLSSLFAYLAGEGIHRVFLQVSSDNAPALRLYRRFSFRTAEEIRAFTLRLR